MRGACSGVAAAGGVGACSCAAAAGDVLSGDTAADEVLSGDAPVVGVTGVDMVKVF